MENFKKFGVSPEEFRDMEAKNYDLVNDMASKLNNLKGYNVGYSNPKKGKMIINYNGENYLVDIEPIGNGSLEDAMNEYGYVFK